ncbi:MAG: hypothetical protein RLZZ426_109, partial [Actinomycetota bacterium]
MQTAVARSLASFFSAQDHLPTAVRPTHLATVAVGLARTKVLIDFFTFQLNTDLLALNAVMNLVVFRLSTNEVPP